MCSAIASKCLKARPATAGKAADACLLLAELGQAGEMVEAVMRAFGDKVPKVAAAAVDVVARAVGDFGAKVVDPKPVLKALPPLFAHPNAGVRDKAKELTVALAACTGAGVVEATLLEKMGDAMRKDVEGAVAALPSRRAAPRRFTRREAAARAAAGPGQQGGEGGAEEGAEGAGAGGAAPADQDEDQVRAAALLTLAACAPPPGESEFSFFCAQQCSCPASSVCAPTRTLLAPPLLSAPFLPP